MDIYHTKKQTENISRSCSYLLLKTLFYFISQCTSVPYLECGLCKLDKELDNFNFTDILMKEIIKCINIKPCYLLGCFHYILNAPRSRSNRFVIFITNDKSFCIKLLSLTFIMPIFSVLKISSAYCEMQSRII